MCQWLNVMRIFACLPACLPAFLFASLPTVHFCALLPADLFHFDVRSPTYFRSNIEKGIYFICCVCACVYVPNHSNSTYIMLYGFGVPLVNHDKRKTSVIQLIEQVKYYPFVQCTYIHTFVFARMIEN